MITAKLRRSTVATVIVGLLLSVAACSTSDPVTSSEVVEPSAPSGSAASTADASDEVGSSASLPVVDVSFDETNASSVDDLVNRSTVVATATLTSIDSAGLRGGPNEDEFDAEFVEMATLDFEVDDYIKGDGDSIVPIRWDTYLVESVDGEPGERYAELTIAGLRFDESDLGTDYVLFMAPIAGRLWPTTTADGIASVDDAGLLQPTIEFGVLGRDPVSVDDLRELVSR